MSALEKSSPKQPTAYPNCVFGLIVTGKSERDALPSLFRQLMERAGCFFRVIGFIGQRSPITSPARKLIMVGAGKQIPNIDEQLIGLPARRFLASKPCHFVVLIDDVEAARRSFVNQVYARYRAALDTMLQPAMQSRAAVHFFANMLEAYYFAHSDAVNRALGFTVLAADFDGDVEMIRHPKNQLKELFPGFDERAHGATIIPLVDLDIVLANPKTCGYLRSLVGWCVQQLLAKCQVWDENLSSSFQLSTGVREQLTNRQ